MTPACVYNQELIAETFKRLISPRLTENLTRAATVTGVGET